jgi:hypothetical protein
MSVNLDKKVCDTLGCRNTATHILTTPSLDFDDSPVTYTDQVCEPCGQGYTRRPALRATLAPMAPPAMPQSGYTPCACRDCMDETVSSDTDKPELCELCAEAGCEAYPAALAAVDYVITPAACYECQRDDAYDQDA